MDGTLNLPAFKIGLSLRAKALGFLLLLLTVFVVALYVFAQAILLDGFEDIERDLARDDLQRVLNVLDNEMATLNTTTIDWAEWNDTYEFASDANAEYIESNLIDSTYDILRINLLMIFNSQDEMVYGQAYRLDEQLAIPLNNVLIAQYLNFGTLRQYEPDAQDTDRLNSGLILSPRGPMMIAVHPILTSEGEGPPNGTLIMGRYLNEAAIAQMATTATVDMDLRYIQDPALPDDFIHARGELLAAGGSPMHVDILDADTLAGYALVNDITGNPALIVRVDIPRSVYHEAFGTIHFFLFGLIVSGLLLVGGMLLLLERQILSRVLRLSGVLNKIGRNGSLEHRVVVTGQDEIALLGSSINGMLGAIQQAQQSLSQSQLRAERIITSISDVLYVVHVDAEGQVLSHQLPSPRLAELTGYPMAEFEADWRFWQALVHPDDRDIVAQHIPNVLRDETTEIEYRIRCADGSICWLRDSMYPNVEPDGTVTVYGVLSDITIRKRTEAHLAQSERTARAFQEHLKALLEVDVALAKVESQDELHRRIVELSHERLGFDRMALFLLEDGGEIVTGTFAIDEHGELRDQRDLRRPVAEDPAVEAMLANHELTRVWKGTAFTSWDEADDTTWNAVVTLWSGDRPIGWLAADNLIHRKPLKPFQIELLSLVGTSVSYLFTRVQAERALRDSEARYRALFEEATDAILMVRNSIIVDCNSRALEMFGVTRGQFIGQPLYHFSPPRQPDGRNSREMVREKLKLALVGGPQVFEWQHMRSDKTLFSSEASASSIEIADEMYLQVLIRDITARKAAEDALRESEERYFTLFDRMPIELYRSTPEGKLLEANPAFLHLLGYDDITKKRLTDMRLLYVEPSDRLRWRKALELEQSGVLREFEVHFRRPDGTTFWASNTARAVRGPDGSVQYYEGSIRDITMRKQAQDALRQSEERLDLALNAAGLGLWDWYLKLDKVIYNQRWADITGYTMEELGNRSGIWPTIVHPDDWPRVDAQMQKHLAGHLPVFEVEYRLRSKSGDWLWILDRGKVVSRDADGTPLRITGTLLDITRRKESEAEREHLLHQMRSRAAELATVAEISQQATRILDMHDLLWKACELIGEKFELYHVQVYLYKEDVASLKWAAGKGADDDVITTLRESNFAIPLDRAESIVARAARDRKPIRVNDVLAKGVEFLPNTLLPDTCAEMALPMVVGDTLIGVLDVQDNRVDRFDEQDLHIQTTLAAQIAVALYNARLFSDNARRLAIIEHSRDAIALFSMDSQSLVPHYLNPAALRLLGYDSLGAIPTQESLDRYYPPKNRAELHETIIPTVMEQGVWRGETEICVGSDDVIPVEQTIFLINEEQGQPRDLASMVTDITARRQTENALHRANRAFRTLSECNQAMVRATNESALLREICELIVSVGGYRMAWVGLVPESGADRTSVQPVARAGFTNGYLDTVITLRKQYSSWPGPSRRAVMHGEPVIVRNLASDANFDPWRNEALNRGYRAMITLPLQSANDTIGTLNVYADAVDVFSDDEIALLRELASDLAYGVTVLRTRAQRQVAVQQLSESEANLSALIENTTAAIWSLDRQLRLVTANANAQHFFPYILDADPEPDTSMLASVKPALRDDWQALLKRVWQGERFVIERDFVVDDAALDDAALDDAAADDAGEQAGADVRKSYEIWFSPIQPDADRIVGVTIFATDVTQRKQDEARLVQLNARLARRNRQLLALYDAGRVLTATFDEYEIYRVLYNHIVDPVFGAQTLIVARYDPDEALIRCQFAIVNGDEQDPSTLAALPLGDGPNSQTIRTGEPRIVTLPASAAEVEAAPGRYIQLDEGYTAHSAVYIPLMVGDEVTSVFNVQHEQPDAFSEDDVSLLLAVANQVAGAIKNAQLFTAEHEQRTLAEALQATTAAVNSTLEPDAVMDRMLTNLQRVVPNDAASIMLIEDGVARIMRHSGFEERGLAEFVNGLRFNIEQSTRFQQMIETRQPVRFTDTHHASEWLKTDELAWIRSSIGAPILAGDRLLGVLNVDSAKVGFFTASHAQQLQAFADQVSIAVQNAQLFVAEREQRQFAETLRAIAATINLSQDPDSVLDELLRNIKHVVPHDAATLLLIEDWEARIACASGFEVYGLHDWVRELRIDTRTNMIAAGIMQTGEPVIIPDTLHHPGWQHWPETDWQRSCITVPIQREGGVCGFLNLYSTQPDFFTAQHVERLQAFAHQAANAIMNVRLFAAEREQRVLSEVLRETIGAINTTLDPDAVLDRILTNLQRVVPHDAANIMLIENDMLEIHRAHGYAERGYEVAISQWRYPITDVPLLQSVIEMQQPLVVDDTQDEPTWRTQDMPESVWIRSSLKAPIQLGGEVIGLFNLDSARPNAFTADHVQSLQVFAEYAAAAMRNARLFAAERDHRQFAEALRDTAAAINRTLEFDRVLDFVLTNAQRVMPHDAANIMLIEDGIARVVRGRGYEKYGTDRWIRQLRFVVSDVPIWRRMLQSGHPVAVSDTRTDPDWVFVTEEAWIRSSVKAPIRVEGRSIGILHLDSETAGAFTPAHAERLQAFADQAATALRNAEFFAAEHAQRTLAEALRATAEAISGTLEFDEVLDRILYYVGLVVPYDSASLMLIDQDEVHVVAQSPEATLPEDRTWLNTYRFMLNETPNLLEMYETGAPLVLSRVDAYKGWKHLPPMDWIESFTGAPIRHEGQVIGFIGLDSATPDFYTSEHADRLQAFADQAAIAIRNAQLFEAVQRYAEDLEQRVAARTAEVEQHSAQLRAILDSITEGVVYDEKLRVKYTNRAMTELTGYEAHEFTHYLDVLRSSDLTQADYETLVQMIYEHVEREGFWQGDITVRRKEQSEFEAQLTVTQVRNSDGMIDGAVSVLRDVSQEKELQRQKDRFIASASHELRTPLTNFKTRLYLLKAQPDKTPKHLTILNQVVNNMAELVENMLDMSRFERGVIPLRRREAVLQDLVRDVIGVQRAETETKQIDLRVELADEPLRVRIDVQRMRQVITNLIANAINYTSQGGTITVTLAAVEDRARLRVRDTGIGIPEDQIAQIFEPFFRANKEAAEGTGLGLTIAREIVCMHNGTIDVTSVQGEGSTFTVELDLLD